MRHKSKTLVVNQVKLNCSVLQVYWFVLGFSSCFILSVYLSILPHSPWFGTCPGLVISTPVPQVHPPSVDV